MAKNPYKETVKQLFDLRKKAMAKNATELDVLRYTYFSMEVVKDNLQEEQFTALLKEVYSTKFRQLESIQEVVCRLMQARTCPALFYDESITSKSPNLAEVKNRADVIMCVERSNWKQVTTDYFKTKNLAPGKVEDYTKALMLLEQIGLENAVALNVQKYTKSKLKAFIGKSKCKGFLSCKHEVQSAMTKAKIAVLGGQEKYDELMKILSGEIPFDERANGVLKEALKNCNGFGQLINNLNASVNRPTIGDYRIAHQIQKINERTGLRIPQPGENGTKTMGMCLADFASVLKLEIVDKIYDLQSEHGIYQNPPEEVQVQEKQPTPAVVVEEAHDDHTGAHRVVAGDFESGDEGM